MTKYVLNSGGVKHGLRRKREFHQEIVQGLGVSPKFLLCNFAQGREYWETKFAGYAQSIAEDLSEGVTPSFELALPDTFIRQCDAADVIYFHGGDNDLLFYWMRKFDYSALFARKVIATSSASSCMIATNYWTCDWRACQDGFGILPIKFIPHYESDFGNDDPRGPIDWSRAYSDLESYGKPGVPILALHEGEYKIFEVA